MGYHLTEEGFDALRILGVFGKELDGYEPSPTVVKLDHYAIQKGLGGKKLLADKDLYSILEELVGRGMLAYVED